MSTVTLTLPEWMTVEQPEDAFCVFGFSLPDRPVHSIAVASRDAAGSVDAIVQSAIHTLLRSNAHRRTARPAIGKPVDQVAPPSPAVTDLVRQGLLAAPRRPVTITVPEQELAAAQ